MRGNVMDMAVGIIIGAAFGKIVASLVADVIMPPIGLLLGDVDFTAIKLILKKAVLDVGGKVVEPAVTINLNLGTFVQTAVDFLIIAAAIFLMIKIVNRLQRKHEAAAAAPAPAPAEPPAEVKLLTEIRDLLKK